MMNAQGKSRKNSESAGLCPAGCLCVTCVCRSRESLVLQAKELGRPGKKKNSTKEHEELKICKTKIGHKHANLLVYAFIVYICVVSQTIRSIEHQAQQGWLAQRSKHCPHWDS
eukprot:GHVU01061341.1.p1 GENE.GHVU01061341.1~~GHVU01061341.1.p1  ORF type:complete len:113 (+),score=4.86 GHVU01061341.1:211-549(+)